jgi:hypothetical protein
LLAELIGDARNCEWIYRIRANLGMPRGGSLPPIPVLAPGSALGSRPRVALSSAQVPGVYSQSGARGKFWLGPSGTDPLSPAAPGPGRRQLPPSVDPDLLGSTGQVVGRRHVTDGAVQPDRVVQLIGARPTVPRRATSIPLATLSAGSSGSCTPHPAGPGNGWPAYALVNLSSCTRRSPPTLCPASRRYQ